MKNINKTNILLILLLIIGIVLGFISYWDNKIGLDWKAITGNLSSELIGAVVLYLIIEKIINKDENEISDKNKLLIKMESVDNNVALDAIRILHIKGWLQDGSLKARYFNGANLKNADLRKANLSNVGFYRCNLENSQIDETQLANLSDLRFTIMQDGKRYNGRFRLKGDLEWAKTKYNIDYINASIETMAKFYNVSQLEYINGQKWAEKNLTKLFDSI